MRIHIEVVPHKSQRYATAGDWQFRDGDLYVQVSNMENWKYEALVGLHEAIEALMCKDRGITEAEVDAFDKEFEAARESVLIPEPNIEQEEFFVFKGQHLSVADAEPGDFPNAPYYTEHQFASCLERLIALELGVNWQDYDQAVNSL